MPSPSPSEPLILDGALATELEALDVPLHAQLWSAAALRDNPAAIRSVHASYFAAGAHVATTASYQASIPGLRAAGYGSSGDSSSGGGGADEAVQLVAKSVALAREAADEAGGGAEGKRQAWVAGSVGPYGAFLADGSEYTGRYALGREGFKDFHRGRIAALLNPPPGSSSSKQQGGADILALETMPSGDEIAALLELLRDEFPGARAWLSVTVRRRGDAVRGGAVAVGALAEMEGVEDVEGLKRRARAEEGGEEEVVLSDGTPLKEVCRWVEGSEQVVAVGVNCVPQELVTPSLRVLRRWSGKTLVCYPNSGEVWDAQGKVWKGGRTEGGGLEAMIEEWWKEGARWIGGCCRMGPRDIAVVKRTVERLVGGGA